MAENLTHPLFKDRDLDSQIAYMQIVTESYNIPLLNSMLESLKALKKHREYGQIILRDYNLQRFTMLDDNNTIIVGNRHGEAVTMDMDEIFEQQF